MPRSSSDGGDDFPICCLLLVTAVMLSVFEIGRGEKYCQEYFMMCRLRGGYLCLGCKLVRGRRSVTVQSGVHSSRAVD